MSLKRFLEPISPENPCGPDLFEAMDDPFESYMLQAEDRLPQQFFNAEGRFRVDPGSIKVQAEIDKAAALMERSRDLRVLAWLAQFCAAARDLGAMVEAIELMAELLETYGAQLHPRTSEDEIDRCNAIEMLDGASSMRLPLEFMPLAKDRRLNVLTWRRVAIADGRRNPVSEDGEPGDLDALMAALRSAENSEQVTASHGLVTRLKEAMTRIEYACLADESRPFRPNLEKVHGQIDALLALLHEARPDLAGEEAMSADATQDDEGTGPDSGPASTPSVVPAGSISSPRQARLALEALELYFARNEPSSPSFLLVRQARQLQGRPLVEALELLVPSKFEDARIDFSRDMGFVMTMERMRALSDLEMETDEDAAGGGSNEDIGEDGPSASNAEPESAKPSAVTISTRSDASSMMSALERYFTATEPSSPIPLLLTRARGYLNQSFSAILAEMFPPDND